MPISNKIIVLSPCIAKKNEFMETGLVEYNVTFQKLEEFFEKNLDACKVLMKMKEDREKGQQD